jgi:hypothetical protein
LPAISIARTKDTERPRRIYETPLVCIFGDFTAASNRRGCELRLFSGQKHAGSVNLCRCRAFFARRAGGKAYYALRTTVPKGSNEAAGLLSEQREFLKNRTKTCPIPGNPMPSQADTSRIIACLKGFYTLRLNELQKRLAASAGQNAQTGLDGKAADIPPDLLATLQNDLSDEFPDPDCPPLKNQFAASWLDLNPQRAALLLDGLQPCLRGQGSGTLLVYIRTDHGWRKIFDGMGDYVSRRVNSTRGWHDLVLYEHAAAHEFESVYQFDGKVYKKVACSQVDLTSASRLRTSCPNPVNAWATAGQKVDCDKVMAEVHAGKKTEEIDKDLSISSSSVYKCKKKAAAAAKSTPPKAVSSAAPAAASSPASH